jgi:glutamyl-tRNA synthetase/nondiscriminating glutamyl-tRNA synthetase
VGNARTALFNWLFARHFGGAIVLRIEDTDVERSKGEYEQQLLADLRWFGIDWDEGPDKGGEFGPYRQSERKETYSQLAARLIDQGHAYFCFCTPEQLEQERQEALKGGLQPRYSGRCRKRPREEAARKVAAGEPAAIRLKIAPSAFSWNDLVHGPTSFSAEVIGDPILVRSDGNPNYNYAPQFAHLSTILGSDRTRLSKRHGATSLESFREMGILPEALRNYLALLGWSPADGKTEILSPQELVQQFSLEHITKSPAVFDQEKLYWLNRHYMKECPPSRLAELAVPFLHSAGYLDERPTSEVLAWLERVLDAVLKNINVLRELPDAVRIIFEYDAGKAVQELELSGMASARVVLHAFIPKVLAQTELSYERFRALTKEVQNETGNKGRDLFHPIRVALTGAASGPELEKLIPIFEAGAKLPLPRHVKSVAERLSKFADEARTREGVIIPPRIPTSLQ